MFRRDLLWTSLLIAVGLIGGALFNWPTSDPDPIVIEDVNVDETPAGVDDRGQGFSLSGVPASQRGPARPIEFDDLRKGDSLLTGGNYIGAYRYYTKLRRTTDSENDGSLSVRLGLSSELASFLEQAEDHYRDAVESPSASLLQQLWALIGTARVWEAQNRVDESVSLLSELFLVYGSDEYPDEIRLPIHKHLSDCLQRQFLRDIALDPETGDVIKPIAVRYFWTATAIEPILDPQIVLPEQDPNASDDLDLRLIQKPQSDVSLITVDASTSFYPMLQFLNELSKSLNQDIRVSNRARAVLANRSTRMNTGSLSVSTILDQLLGALPVFWWQDQGVVYLSHYDEAAPREVESFHLDRIQRLLRQLQINFQDPQDVPAAVEPPIGIEKAAILMQEGNNYLLREDIDTAVNLLQSARDRRPTGELSAMLFFNRGVLESDRGNFGAAVRRFYHALDQSLSPDLQAAAYANVAELELNLGRAEQAIPAAARGRRLSKDSEVVEKNLMVLAKAYLLYDDPYSANQALFDHSESLTSEEVKRLAGVLASYARFQIVKPVHGLRSEGERLVISLAALKPGDAKTYLDHLLVARAYRSVSFRSKAIEHLQVASTLTTPGYWGERIQLELARTLVEADQPGRALETIRPVVQSGEDAIVLEATLLGAQCLLKLERYAECQTACESILAKSPDEETAKIALETMGKAYQEAGDHVAAAICFAGSVPERTDTESSGSNRNGLSN